MAALLLAARGWPGPTHPVALGLVLVLPLMPLGPVAVLGGLGALPLLAGVTWWAQDIDLGWLRGLAFVLLGGLAAWLPRLFSQSAPVPAAAVLLPVGALGLLFMLMTGPFGTPLAFWLLWHHWGPFVSPAEAILAGFVPFRDFPVQYGMGPALTVAAVCGGDCWGALYVVAGTANLLYALAVATCALLGPMRARPGIMAAAAAAAAALLWTGFPPHFVGPLAFPSVAGLRFLPVAGLLLAILLAERHGRAPGWAGHGLWALAVAWSPEAAAYASIVWWPYLALRRAQAARRARGAARAVARRPAGGWRLAVRPRPASAGLQARLWGMAALPRLPRLRQQPAGGAPAELVRPALPGDRRHPGRLLGAAPAGPVASAVGLRLYGGLRRGRQLLPGPQPRQQPTEPVPLPSDNPLRAAASRAASGGDGLRAYRVGGPPWLAGLLRPRRLGGGAARWRGLAHGSCRDAPCHEPQ